MWCFTLRNGIGAISDIDLLSKILLAPVVAKREGNEDEEGNDSDGVMFRLERDL